MIGFSCFLHGILFLINSIQDMKKNDDMSFISVYNFEMQKDGMLK